MATNGTRRKKRRTDAFDVVREIGLALPGASEGRTYGAPALKVDGKMFACLAINRSAEPHSLVAQVGFVNRDLLIAKDPATYYVTHHYVGGPVVLVRLTRIVRKELTAVLQMAWRYMSNRSSDRLQIRNRLAGPSHGQHNPQVFVAPKNPQTSLGPIRRP
jgi:hypothetical protein